MAEPSPPAADSAPKAKSRVEQDREDCRQRRVDRYNEVAGLHRKGMSQQAISLTLHIQRKTIRRFLRAGQFPERATPHRRPPGVNKFQEFLHRRWDEGCHNATMLWREIQGQTALEVGWLLAELEQRFGYSLEELARRFDRSVSWVSRRLALVETLPEAIQRQVREGKIAAQVAMKFLVPAVRISLEACQRMAAIFAQYHCDTREAGQLYATWRNASQAIRQRILDSPDLFF